MFRVVFSVCLFLGVAFAQEVPAPVVSASSATGSVTEPVEVAEAKKFAVYVSGASVGVNKSLGSKLITAMSQRDEYSEIGDMEAFYKEIEKSRDININLIIQTAKKHKADEVVFISLMEAFGDYSVQVRLINIGDGQVLKSISLDHTMKSLEDLNSLSEKIAAQLIPVAVAEPVEVTAPEVVPAPVEAPAASASSVTVSVPVVEETCDTKYNKNELLYNVREGFLLGFKNCANELVKETALAKSPLAKKPAPEPASFITQCVMGSIKEKVDGVPGGEKITNVVENFLQTLLKAALSGGDPKTLVNAAANLDITGMMETISGFAKGSSCFVDEPFTPPASSGGGSDGDDESFFSLGFISGVNFSHLYADYGDREGTYASTPGFQVGMTFDFALSSWFHLQPGIMYIQKGAYDDRYYNKYNIYHNNDYRDGFTLTSNYIEIPLLVSLKFSALRLNVGPYFSICPECINNSNYENDDFGINMGFGFDIGMFYIGIFYDYGLNYFKRVWLNASTYDENGEYKKWDSRRVETYNRTLGFNIGVNL